MHTYTYVSILGKLGPHTIKFDCFYEHGLEVSSLADKGLVQLPNPLSSTDGGGSTDQCQYVKGERTAKLKQPGAVKQRCSPELRVLCMWHLRW